MADPDDAKWDLSENDRAAIRTLLENYRECVGESLRNYSARRAAAPIIAEPPQPVTEPTATVQPQATAEIRKVNADPL